MEYRKSQLFWLLTVGSLANCLLVYIEATLLMPSNYASVQRSYASVQRKYASHYVKNPLYPIIQ